MKSLTGKRLYALLELLSLTAFLVGFFGNISWLSILGGTFLLFDDVMSMLSGVLNPLFPFVLSVLLAISIDPWYMGVFWSAAAFKILNIPTNISVILRPERYPSLGEVEDLQKDNQL